MNAVYIFQQMNQGISVTKNNVREITLSWICRTCGCIIVDNFIGKKEVQEYRCSKCNQLYKFNLYMEINIRGKDAG